MPSGTRSVSGVVPARSTSCTARRSAGPSPRACRRSSPCTTSRSSARPRSSRAGTAYMVALVSSVSCGQPTRSSRSPSSVATRRSSSPGFPPSGFASCHTASIPSSARTARARTATTSLRSRRSSRGRISNASSMLRARPGVELRVVGARGWGGVEVDGWVGETPGCGARCAVPRRPVRLVPVAVRGIRAARARGDGVRDAGRDLRRDGDGGGRRRGGGSRRPARRRIDRRRRSGRHMPGGTSSSSRGGDVPRSSPGSEPRTRSSISGATSREGRRLRCGRSRTPAHG